MRKHLVLQGLLGTCAAVGVALAAPALADPAQPTPALSRAVFAADTPHTFEAPKAAHADSGWVGLQTRRDGKSADLTQPYSGWSDDASAGAKDVQTGYAWRGGPASAVIGYGQYDDGPRDNPAEQRAAEFRHDASGDPGVLGVSLLVLAQ